MIGLHIVYIKLQWHMLHVAWYPAARHMVEEAIDHDTVAVHQSRATVSILLV